MIALALALGSPSADAASPRKAYLREHRACTRELKLYRDFSTALLLRATLLEPPFRTALAAERQRLVNPSAEDQAAFVARMERDAAAYHDVVFAADSAYANATRFGNTDATWNLRLLVDGVEATLVSVEQVRNPSPLHDALYTQHNLWSDLWIARFERVEDGPLRVELLVGSGYGNGSVVWEHDPPSR
jgi:hypothetical protein